VHDTYGGQEFDAGGRLHVGKTHVRIDGGTAPKFMLLPGDPARVPLIGTDWDTYDEVSFNREFRFSRGSLEGVELGACSTGIGAPSAEIALIELAAAGSDTFIRVGSCAAVQPEIAPGTLVIQEGAVRFTGTADAYCDREFPAIADRDVTAALIEACEQLGFHYTVGLTASTDSFYAGQNNMLPTPLELPPTVPVAARMQSFGVATFEMEAALLFVLGRLLKRRCGSICAVESNRVTGERAASLDATRQACRAASRAAAILHRWDVVRIKARRQFVSASLLTGHITLPPEESASPP
jgi:uridine phosphorylase